MNTRPYVAAAALFALAALLAASGCSRQPATSPDLRGLGRPDPIPATPKDTTPIVPPPPAPAPPLQPVVYLGADSAIAGGTVTLTWGLLNESQVRFTMQWALESRHAWPGYPVNGTVHLPAGGSATLSTTASVPDTAGPGPRWSRITVSRPSGLPPASAEGGFHVFR